MREEERAMGMVGPIRQRSSVTTRAVENTCSLCVPEGESNLFAGIGPELAEERKGNFYACLVARSIERDASYAAD